ncbi:hypothetical protein [Leminorella grimontii]
MGNNLSRDGDNSRNIINTPDIKKAAPQYSWLHNDGGTIKQWLINHFSKISLITSAASYTSRYCTENWQNTPWNEFNIFAPH